MPPIIGRGCRNLKGILKDRERDLFCLGIRGVVTGSGDWKENGQQQSTKLRPQKASGQNSDQWAGLASEEGREHKLYDKAGERDR